MGLYRNLSTNLLFSFCLLLQKEISNSENENVTIAVKVAALSRLSRHQPQIKHVHTKLTVPLKTPPTFSTFEMQDKKQTLLPKLLLHNRDMHSLDNHTRRLLYLTIIPLARMGSESIAHEAEGRVGY